MTSFGTELKPARCKMEKQSRITCIVTLITDGYKAYQESLSDQSSSVPGVGVDVLEIVSCVGDFASSAPGERVRRITVLLHRK